MSIRKGPGILAIEKRMGISVEQLPEIFPWQASVTWYEEHESPGWTDRETGQGWRIVQDKNGKWSKCIK